MRSEVQFELGDLWM